MSIESQWVTFKTGNETYGVEIQFVQEMLRMPQVHSIPRMPSDNMGVILLRKEVIPVFDLHAKFGLESQQAQAEVLVELLRGRLQDHENWLNELRLCIEEKREFGLARDPHKCAFGRWYDTFTTEDHYLVNQLKKFDSPHKRIHALADEVMNLANRGEIEDALKLVQSSKTGILDSMIKLFNETIDMVIDQSRPSLIVIGSSSCRIAIAVDEICSVVNTFDDEIQPPDAIPGIDDFGGLIGLLEDKGSKKMIMLIDPAELFPQLVAS
jgi:chemotaxis signal transduction protein